jgi:hypothetical protein
MPRFGAMLETVAADTPRSRVATSVSDDDNKYLYDPAAKTFKGAPKAVNEKLSDPQFAAGIAKAMALLGEKP